MKKYPGAIVITGASGGIGTQLVEYLINHGVREIICQYKSNPEPIVSVLTRHSMDPDKHCYKADLCNEQEARALTSFAQENSERVWGLVNLAGASANGMAWKLSMDDFINVINSNLVTTFLSCREFIPGMRAAAGGRIINVSSVIAFTGIVGASHYCAAKAGIVGFTKAIAQELASKSITANTLALGYFQYGLIEDVPADMLAEITNRIPLKKLGTSEAIGGIVSYLLDESSGYTTGQVVHINGGLY